MTFRKSVALIFLIYDESLFSLDGVFERNKRSFVRFARNLIVDSYVEMMTHDLFLETSDVLESDENQNLRS